ncbi:MAG: helix-turn-helix domain-containing protein [Nanoarchaeota archaeon]
MLLAELLEGLKFNRYERAAILYLARVNQANAQSICKGSRIPQGRVYSVLDELRTQGIVTLFPTSPKQYKIDNLKEALSNYIWRKQADLSCQEEQIRSVQLDLKKDEKTINPASIALYKGRAEHLAAVAALNRRAKKQILQVAPRFVGNSETRFTDLQALHRGVQLKIIIYKVTVENKTRLKECLALGAQIRSLNDARIFSLTIQDDQELLLGVQDTKLKEERMILYTRNPALLKNLKSTFYALWKQAKPVLLK